MEQHLGAISILDCEVGVDERGHVGTLSIHGLWMTPNLYGHIEDGGDCVRNVDADWVL